MTLSLDHPKLTSIEQSIGSEVFAYLQHQQELFDQARSQLLQTHPRQFVWFENGVVLDSDRDESALFLRTQTQRPEQPFFLAQVLQEDPKLVVRSGFLR
ncbi:MAG: hypothetical protein HC860_05465 [Alkalinema sp. RU_4_3]|nr:hypothetical protein [Alkalinema sp. RU_4_3]